MALRLCLAALAACLPSITAIYVNGSVVAPCDSPVYCQGEMLKAIELARPFFDSKTFVDMPTTRPLNEVITAFNQLQKPLSNNTELNAFLSANFGPAGGELDEVSKNELQTNATFLDRINDTVIKEFVTAVINIWPDLTRKYVGSQTCDGCVGSFVAINNTFVVAGGRFREPYYWDSFWILEGLLRTGGSFTEISKNIINNFLDLVEEFGFVPNGARVYYLSRSQPPLLSQMVKIYVGYTGDRSILERALPLLIMEHEFWTKNRTVSVKASDGKTYTLNRFAVENNQPRPESYREDYITANNESYYSSTGTIYPQVKPLSEEEKAHLYANLASGAESGWDYSSRWLSRPEDAARDIYFPLRSLNVHDTIPVDLNSILYQNEVTIGEFIKLTGNPTAAAHWADLAEKRSQAMSALLWNATLWSYYDYNTTSKSQNIYVPCDDDAVAGQATAPAGYQVGFNVGQLYPFWTGAAPVELKGNPAAVLRAYAVVESMLDSKQGGIPATNFRTSQQWDQPNVWPPLQYVLMQGLLNTPASSGIQDPSYVAVQNLAVRLAQRYVDSTFCTWYATGGSTSETPKLQGASPTAVGIMFEKYADNSTIGAGGGGEYEVVEGFGWTNGVLIWAVDTFRNALNRPVCGDITAAQVHTSAKRSLEQRAVELDPYDATWTKKFGKRALV